MAIVLLATSSAVLPGVDTNAVQFGGGVPPLPHSHREFPNSQTAPQNNNSPPKEQESVAVNPAYTGREVDTKANISKKVKPKYTKEARANKVEGTVVLKVVFASSGKVENIHIVSGLPFGLTERSIEAAHKIKFKPAIKDGRPVSMWIQLEYNFYLH